MVGLLNNFYFKREKKFLYQTSFDSETGLFNIHKKLTSKYLKTEHVAKTLVLPEDYFRNRELREKNEKFRSIEQILSDYSSSYLATFNKNLFQNRYDSVIYKSSTNVRCIDENQFFLNNYFTLSKFNNKDRDFSKKIYMYYLSRVFY